MTRYNATWLRNQRSQCSPLPPLTPLPPPACQKPPPPWSFFIISLGCDLHKPGAGTTSRGDRGKTGWWDRKQEQGGLKWRRAVRVWDHHDDKDLKLPKTRHIYFILPGVPISKSFPFRISAPQFIPWANSLSIMIAISIYLNWHCAELQHIQH